jgi:hypothetical protein
MMFPLAIAAASVLFGGASVAGPVTQTVTVDGSVTSVCVMDAPSPPSIDLGQLAAASGVRTGKLTTIGDQTVALDNTFCNYGGTHLTVSATALVDSSPTVAPGGFDKAVNFTANVSGWTSSPASVTTNAAFDGSNPTNSANGGSQGLPKSANLTLVLTGFSTPGDGFLIGGSYSGSVTVTVGPDAAD